MRGNIFPAWPSIFIVEDMVLKKVKRCRWSPWKMTRSKFSTRMVPKSLPLGAGITCDVGEKRKLKVATGDKLLLQSNWQKKFVNGELVEVKAIQGDSGLLPDGRVIPADYRTFTHGYAVTSHAAQGKTADEVLVVASSRSLPAVHQEQFYVSISRGRERCLSPHDTDSSLAHHPFQRTAGGGEAMPQRDFLQTILQRGNRFLKRFRQRIAQSLSFETTGRSSHEIKPTTTANSRPPSQRLTRATNPFLGQRFPPAPRWTCLPTTACAVCSLTRSFYMREKFPTRHCKKSLTPRRKRC